MAGLSAFNSRSFNNRGPSLQDQTISDFSGGLNVVDNDTTMRTKYAKVLKNWQQGTDGSLSVRFGTKFRFDVAGIVYGEIIELVYFWDSLVAFTDAGEIARIDGAGTITAIWNDAIADTLPGNPNGWSTGLVAIDTHTFRSDLLVHNGVDKPLIINENFAVTYLQDPATGSNVFTPIGKYGTTVANYSCIAGIENSPGEVYISSTGTSGVYVGDADPNDGISINVAAYAPETDGVIIGLASFRNNLIVLFDGGLVALELGIFNDDVHEPAPQDTIVERGVISYRTFVTNKNDVMMADMLGYHTLNRNSFGLIDTKNFSELVEPEYQADTPSVANERIKCFSVYNSLEHRMMTFMPDGKGWTNTFAEGSKEHKWTNFEGWQWSCGCTTRRGRIFFAKGTKIFQYGNRVYAGEDYSADFIDEFDFIWNSGIEYHVGERVKLNDTIWYCIQDHNSTDVDDPDDPDWNEYWTEYFGMPIAFDWELPWFNINSRARKKSLKFIQADTSGRGAFDIDVFVDNFYRNADGEYTPAITTRFVAGDAPGYGNFDQPYGGGRRLRDERPWGLPADFKIMKLRISGETIYPLSIQTLTILFFTGTYRR